MSKPAEEVSAPLLAVDRSELSNSSCPDNASCIHHLLSKPGGIHPILIVLFAVLFVSLSLGLLGGSLIFVFMTVVGLLVVWTAVVFLILFVLVWLLRTIYLRRHAS